MKPLVALLGVLLVAGCVVPPQQPYYVTRPFIYAPAPAVPEVPYQPAPLVFQPPTPLTRPDPAPQLDPAPQPADPPVTASVPEPASTVAPTPTSPIQKTDTPDTNSNVPMMGFRPMRGQKPPGA